MLDFNTMEHLKLYRSVVFFPDNKEDKSERNLIILNTKSVEGSIKIILDKIIKNKLHYKSYYYEFYYKFSLFNKPVTEKVADMRTDSYVMVKTDCQAITKTFIGMKQYKQGHLYYDFSHYNDIFFNRLKGSYNMQMVIKNYLNLLNMVMERTAEYKNKFMIINIDEWQSMIADSTSYRRDNVNDPFGILVNIIRYFPEELQKLNLSIIFRKGNLTTKLDCTKIDKNTLSAFKSAMVKMGDPKEQAFSGESEVGSSTITIKTQNNKVTVEDQNVTIEEKPLVNTDTMKIAVSNKVIENMASILEDAPTEHRYFTGENPDKVVEKTVTKTVDKLVKENKIKADTPLEEADKAVKEELQKDEQFMTAFELAKSNRLASIMSPNNLARNRELAEKQAKIKVEGKTIDQILNEAKEKELPTKAYKSKVINKDMTTLKLPNLDKVYNEKIYEPDTIAIVNFFKDRSIPVYILDVQKEDSSDDFNKKTTWTVTMESADRQRHKLVFDMPKFVNDSFMYLNGNKKSMYKQMTLLPVSKTAPDTVQVCTNYNKVFLTRMGDKVSPKLERLKKCIPNCSNISFKTGDSSIVNKKYKTCIEYDEMAKNFNEITNKRNKTSLYFNQDMIREEIKNKGIKLIDDINMLPLVLDDNKKVTYIDLNTECIAGTETSVGDYIISFLTEADPSFSTVLHDSSIGRRFIYTKAKIAAKDVPLILLLSYVEGLTTVLKKSGIKHQFSDTRPVLKNEDKNNKGIIEFEDGYLLYDRYPLRNSLLLNAMALIPTKNYSYTEFDSKEVYLDIFQDLLGVKMVANVLDNFYDLLIDPITYEILDDLNLPTSFVDLFLHANTLLEDNSYTKQIDMTTCRIRSNEIANAVLYKTLATAYEGYRTTAGNKRPQKMSIPKDQVIKNLQALTTVEDYSTLNPVLEVEKLRAISYKGNNGMNLDRAFTLENRAYDESMLGILALSSPPTGSVGVVRQLPLDANIQSLRGYLKVADSDEELKASNLFSPAELLVPFGGQRDDSNRIAMTTTQSRHVVPCKKYNKLLVGNGADKVLGEVISDDFAFKAKGDGKVVELDEETGVMILKYKNGSVDVVELYTKVTKNGGGGFYIANKLKTDLKLGSTVKEGDIVAYNDKYFQGTEDRGTNFKAGTLTKLALAQGYYTYEDSSMVTDKLCGDMTTQVVMKKEVTLGKNSNIVKIVKKGDYVQVGDTLLEYDTSYDDEGINKMLAGMSDDIGKEIQNLGRKPVKSKYAGIIEDIKVYYTVDEEELSSSLRKTIKEINKPIENARKIINKHTKVEDTNVILQPTYKLETNNGKIKGVTVGEGVLIEFYIKYNDKFKVGDKLTFFCALKSVTCNTVPKGLEAFTELNPDEEISAFMAPSSVLKRMTGSVIDNMFCNKVLIELKRSCKKIYYGK